MHGVKATARIWPTGSLLSEHKTIAWVRLVELAGKSPALAGSNRARIPILRANAMATGLGGAYAIHRGRNSEE
jgi:hypothetical protein